ncbi:major facilitator superfamily transporter [Diaporthe helianthi]|uniref:Major facilitator superfamily transporter n=1 Tax=Diaporthe helianthi TaxID=158607 RepID=A0A2P5HZS3_DIAHE|nr:major facilitator superfamily transporter [Diaporthe helianthi]
MSTPDNSQRKPGRPSLSNIPDEQTPLVRNITSPQPGPCQGSADGDGPADGDGQGDGDDDDIDPDEFDLLLTRSSSYATGLLGPEASETPLLRGDRKYSSSSSSRAGRPPHVFISSRRPSVASEVLEDDLEVADLERAPLFLGGISHGRFWWIFGRVLALHFVSCFDGTIMASSHPVITSYFQSSNSASWLSTAFLLTSTAFQPLLGRLSDTVGRKGPYLVTATIFALATLWCALAQSMASFIAARAVCGIGAGGVMTLGSIIVSDLVPIERRGAYQSYINMVYGVASTSGAALGGFLAENLGWRAEFGIQVPPLLLCVGVSAITIPGDLGMDAQAHKETMLQAMKQFDFRGSFFLTTSITFLILGLNLGGNVLSWSHPFVISSLAIFAAAFPLFLWTERSVSRPIMPLRLIQRSPHANMIFANFLAAFIMNTVLFNMPLYFQAVLLTSATTSGLCLWTKRLKWPLVLGAGLFLIGTVVLSSMQRGWPLFTYLILLVPHSMGQGFAFPGTFIAILAASEQAEQAVVTSTLILCRSVGTVLGIAGSSLIIQNSLWVYLEMYVTERAALDAGFLGGKEEVIEKVRESIEAIGKMKGLIQEQVVTSYEASIRAAFLFCIILAIAGLVLLLPIRLPRLGERKKAQTLGA